PRKIDEVLKHSTTSLRSKSIFVYRPRLPTMRVIGSHAISTRRPPVFVALSRVVVAVVGIGVLVVRLAISSKRYGRRFGMRGSIGSSGSTPVESRAVDFPPGRSPGRAGLVRYRPGSSPSCAYSSARLLTL